MSALQSLAQRLLVPLTFAIGILMLNLVFMFYGTYDQFLSLDRVMHFAGGLAASWIFANACETRVPKKYFFAFVIACTLSIAVLWECAEFFVDFYWNAGLMGDTWDTFEDIALGTAGSIFIVAVKRVLNARKSR